ncbi:MAG: PhaM family polyhydroxyalkanoate granule multifunctional regulatory protein [Pseudomonadota bacterium]
MANPPMPTIPGAAVMTDTLDFVKNLWGSMGVPGMAIPGITAPTLSIEELDKKINDLKAVEAWLNLNMTMLRGTIQALEVQRGTIATLKSMGASMAAAMKQPGQAGKGEASLFDAAPYAAAFFPTSAAGATAPSQRPPSANEAGADSAAAAAAAQMANPAAWWNLLQDQFNQAVKTAMHADPASADGKAGAAPAAQGGASAADTTPDKGAAKREPPKTPK